MSVKFESIYNNFILENKLENVVCKVSTILFLCVNSGYEYPSWRREELCNQSDSKCNFQGPLAPNISVYLRLGKK